MDPMEKEPTKLLIERELPSPKCILYVDMLGFSNLTEDHPNPIVWDFDAPDGIASETSPSEERLGEICSCVAPLAANAGLATKNLRI